MRVAFICNICFVLAMLILWLPGQHGGDGGGFYSLIIILGYVLAIILNAVTNGWFLILFFTRDRLPAIFPSWLLITNFVFFVLQLIFILK